MARRAPRRDLAAVLAEVRALRAEPDERVATEGLRRALEDPVGAVVAAAADVAAERELVALRAPLLAAWARLYEAEDPGCAGKAACATALDRLDHPDPAPFQRGLRWIQMAPAYKEPIDVAGGLRARCAFAIARIGGVDALLHLAEALVDTLPDVRSAGARALAATGEPAAAALALLKIRTGDKDPDVVADALGALLALERPVGLRVAAELVDDPDLADPVTLALGESRLAEALPILEGRLATAFRPRDRKVVLVALGLLRTEGARAFLLGVVRNGHRDDARQAVAALGAHSQAPAMRAAVEEAAAGRGLDDAITETFGR